MRLRATRLISIAATTATKIFFRLPLDGIHTVAAAYSLRKLRTAYSGTAIRVRRSSDNTEADIGFDADGWIDLGALTLHCQAPRRPLDVIASAVAYSTRLVRSTYTGPCMRVRRSSDNAEQDIPFLLSGDLDTGALLAFTGAGSGFVATWYDQSGGARHATQASAANQPRIVNAGVVEALSNRPAVRFPGGAWMNYTNIAAQPTTVNVVVRLNALVANAHITDGAQTSPRTLLGVLGTNWVTFAGSVAAGQAITVGASTVLTATFNGASSIIARNGSSVAANPGTQGMTNQRLGAGDGGVSPVGLNGWMQEFVVVNSLLSTTARELLERSQAGYFGITHASPISGFVTNWYDQSGNGRHATQSVAVNQPRIVNAGVVETINTRPAVLMASASLSTTATVNTPAATISTVTSQPSLIGLLSQYRPFGVSGPLEGLRKWFTPATDGSLRYDGGFTAGSVLPASPLIRSAIRTATSASDWRNGFTGISTVESLPNIAGNISFNPLFTPDTDAVCESILFVTSLSATDRQALELNQGAAFGIAVTNQLALGGAPLALGGQNLTLG